MRLSLLITFIFCLATGLYANQQRETLLEPMSWSVYSTLPPAPELGHQPGLAGAYSGVIGNKLVIAGGANFPKALPWEGGQKRYWADVYILPLVGSGEWVVKERALPHGLAYGVSITLPEGLLLIGGNDEQQVYNKVLLLSLDGTGDDVSLTQWPELPVPLTNMTGALVDDKIYVAGGQEQLENASATKHFYALDINDKEAGWKERDAWPGPPRSFAVSVGQSDGFDNCFYLFSGRNYGPDTPVQVLNDGYVYNPRMNSWKRLDGPSGPHFDVMAGTAFASGENHIVFVGGDDGALMNRQNAMQHRLDALISGNGNAGADSVRILKSRIMDHLNNHPGFSNDVLYYHTITNTLTQKGEVSFPTPVTSNAVKYKDKVYLTSGEKRPGVRTPDILVGSFVQMQRGFGWLNYLVITLYFGVLVWMGWFFSKRQKTTDDYFRGGKRTPWWVVGMSIFGTALSAITFMAIPAKTFATDWSYILLNFGIIAVAPIIIALCIPFYRMLDVTTAYEYLERRFNVAARLIGSASFILFQIGRMGVVLFLPSIAINVVTGLDIYVCISIMGVISLLYTMAGGIEAVIWTDALQVVVLLGGAIFALVIISLGVDGGFTEIISQGTATDKFHLGDVSTDLRNPTLLTMVLTAFFSPLITYGTDQTMVQRYVSTATEKEAGRSVWTNAFLTIPATLIFFFVGTALYVFYQDNPLMLSSTVTGGDSIFPWFIYTQMPAGISGLLIAGLFAAAMSTLSSSMNSAATAYAVDMHFRFGWSDRFDRLKLARISTLILGAAGILAGIMMATWDVKSLWDVFQRILGLVLGGIGGLFFLGMLTKRANATGAIIGLIGSVFVQIWVSYLGVVHLLLFTATGFVSCFAIGYIASLFLPQRKDISNLTVYDLKGRRPITEETPAD